MAYYLCGGLNKNGSHRLIGSCIFEKIERHGHVGRSVSLRSGIWVFRRSSQVQSLSYFLQLVESDVELSDTFPSLCLSIYHHTSHHDHNGPNLWNCKQGYGVSSQQQNPKTTYLHRSICWMPVLLSEFHKCLEASLLSEARRKPVYQQPHYHVGFLEI